MLMMVMLMMVMLMMVMLTMVWNMMMTRSLLRGGCNCNARAASLGDPQVSPDVPTLEYQCHLCWIRSRSTSRAAKDTTNSDYKVPNGTPWKLSGLHMLNLGYPHKKLMWWKSTSHQSCKNLILMQSVITRGALHIPILLSPEYHFSPCAYIAAFKCDSLTQTLLSKMCSCRSIRSNWDVLSESNVKTCMTIEKWKHGH